jgi:hypothetical protein
MIDLHKNKGAGKAPGVVVWRIRIGIDPDEETIRRNHGARDGRDDAVT